MSEPATDAAPAPGGLGDMGNAALAAARAGLPVVQLKRMSKEPMFRWWKSAATCDLSVIAQWWEEQPAANVGIVLPPGVIVLDLDPRNAVPNTDPELLRIEKLLAELEAITGELPMTRTTVTGGGGLHLYYRVPAEITSTMPAESHCEIKGVDILGTGHLVLAPGALHPIGQPYALLEDCPTAELPEHALAALTASIHRAATARAATESPPPARAGIVSEIADNTAAACGKRSRGQASPNKRLEAYADTVLQETHVGNRNNKLFKTLCKGRDFGADDAGFKAITDAWVNEKGLPRDECVRTVNSARRYPVRDQERGNPK